MQKLIIKEPFMGVQSCEIEFDRFLLLIGEQASGKSTIAKLIYFFQSLPEAIFNATVFAKEEESETYIKPVHFQFPIIGSFFSIFGAEHFDCNIEFMYNDRFSISFACQKREYSTSFPIEMFFSGGEVTLVGLINDYLNQAKTIRSNDLNGIISIRREFFKNINNYFSISNTEKNYLIAGRNNIVAFPEYFEKIIQLEEEKLLEETIKEQNLHKKSRTSNENLLLQFVNWSSDIRKYFQNNGGSFKSVKYDLENQDALTIFEGIFAKILKAEYSHNSNGEFLKINEKESVYMKDASSGQQEVLRILQGLYLSVGLKNRREFFVVEEPEAHLYPLAQKELINAFSLFLNTIKEGRLIITTHSPYILACVNILLFAHYVANELPESEKEVLESVQKDFWLDSKMFSVYSLSHEGTYCKNIKDAETGLIDQNYLDLISEQLGLQYNHLYNLLVESHV